jgi:ADP-heptose:LPS heptosyltransferase
VDELRTLVYPGFTRRPNAHLLAPYALLLREAWRLRRERYDAAIIFRPDHWWGALLASVADIPLRVGVLTPETRPLLSHARPPRPDEHAAEQAIGLVTLVLRALGAEGADEARVHALGADAGEHTREHALEPDAGGQARAHALGADGAGQAHGHTCAARAADQLGVEFSVPEYARHAAAAFWRANALDGRTVVVVQPTAGAALKSWPVECWARLVDGLPPDLAVILTGAPGDTGLLEDLRQRCARSPLVRSGQSIPESAALYERARLLVGLDGGAAHVAAAVGTPSVRLYGPAPVASYGPWPQRDDQRVVVTRALACVPCGHLENPPCGAAALPACMLAVSVEDILREVRDVLAARV